MSDYEEYFHGLVRHTQQRQTEVISLVPTTGITAWEMFKLLFPHVKDINRYLAVSETVAHLDFAVAEGRLRSERGDMADTYFPI